MDILFPRILKHLVVSWRRTYDLPFAQAETVHEGAPLVEAMITQKTRRRLITIFASLLVAEVVGITYLLWGLRGICFLAFLVVVAIYLAIGLVLIRQLYETSERLPSKNDVSSKVLVTVAGFVWTSAGVAAITFASTTDFAAEHSTRSDLNPTEQFVNDVISGKYNREAQSQHGDLSGRSAFVWLQNVAMSLIITTFGLGLPLLLLIFGFHIAATLLSPKVQKSIQETREAVTIARKVWGPIRWALTPLLGPPYLRTLRFFASLSDNASAADSVASTDIDTPAEDDVGDFFV